MTFKQLDEGDHVLSLIGTLSKNHPEKVFITSALTKLLSDYLVNHLTGSAQWAGEGVYGRFLKVGGSGWVEGKVRFKVVLEFSPTEPEPPQANGIPELDNYRQ